MQQKNLFHRISAFAALFGSFIVYYLTLPPTVVFWDVGEFCAAAYLLQVPHPPGSPFFLLIGRIASMLPTSADIAVRIHLISAVTSALSVMFLYLVTVRLIVAFRGNPFSTIDKVAVYGASLIGALSLAYGTTFWGNAIEAEVYGLSMFFVTIIIWLSLRWYDHHKEPLNEKYIFLIAYLIGLSIGVHLLAVLTIFIVLMIVYFRRYEFNISSFRNFGIVSVLVFFIVYPGVVKYLPSMLDGDFRGIKSDIIKYIPIVFLIGSLYGIYYSIKHKLKMVNIALISFVLIVIGYSTYTMVIIRANVPDMPMNENDPSNLNRLVSYLDREQYGDAPILERRYSQEPMHTPTWQNYSSDMDFMLRYQINHMYNRYLLWNYIGVEGDWQDAGISWKHTLGIPFLIGLLGLYYHFKKDWKMALPFFVMFLLMGVILALYQNQQQPQPRERDYFYVGSFFVFSMWIAIGLIAIIDFIKSYAKKASVYNFGVGGTLAVFALAIPLNMLNINWFERDRSGNYVAWDYSYNILQTCEKDAIIFTNGDNDTFPLWYLQDVEGIRTDVRIVNLSLVNTPWYINQLKNYEPHGAKKIALSFTDAQIERLQPVLWESRRLEIPVPKDVYAKFGITDTSVINKGKLSFVMQNTLTFGQTKAIKVQDIMVRDIIVSNKWERPIYFAVTVSPDSKIGLDDYLWYEGLAWRLKPIPTNEENNVVSEIVEANLMAENVIPNKDFQYGYRFRGLNDASNYFDENITRLTVNYHAMYLRLSLHYLNAENNIDKAKAVLHRMDENIPLNVVESDWRIAADIMSMYGRIGDEEKRKYYADYLEKKAWELINNKQVDMGSYYNPYRILLEIYESNKDYVKSIDVLKRLEALYPNDPGLKNRIMEMESKLKQEVVNKDTSIR